MISCGSLLLFERGGELTLTYAGERLYLLAQRICSLEQEILRETGEISDRRRGRLRLGISYTCGRAILPRLLPAFRAEHPLVEISLVEGNHQKLNEWLAAGEIDVLLGYAPIDVPGAVVYPLLQERLFLACPRALTERAATRSSTCTCSCETRSTYVCACKACGSACACETRACACTSETFDSSGSCESHTRCG